MAFEAEASRVVDPESVAPLLGMRTLVVGLLIVIPTPELYEFPDALKACDTNTYEPLGAVEVLAARPSVLGRGGRAENRCVITVDAAEEQEFDAGCVRSCSMR